MHPTNQETYTQCDETKGNKKNTEQKTEMPAKTSNMAFFVSIVRSLNLNYKRLAELTGVSQQLISFWIATDDIKLSRLLDIFDKIGIRLECSFIPISGNTFVTKNDDFTIEIGDLPQFKPKPSEKNEVIGRMLSNNVRLRFLAECIDNTGMDLVQFCKEMNYQYFTVYQWITKDDIKISRLYEIAKKTRQTLKWKVTGKQA